MLTAYSRVTVVTAERKVDLALPSALPIADVVPQVLRYCAPESSGDQATSWTLARLGGPALALSQTLTDAGVLDGDVMELRGNTSDVRPAMAEDVRDAVEDSADAAGGVWLPGTTITFSLLSGAAAFLLLAAVAYFMPDLMDTTAASDVVGVCATVLVLLGMAAWAAYFASTWVAQVCVGVAMVWGYLAGVTFGAHYDLDSRVTLILAVVLAAVVAGVARAITPAAMGHVATAVVLLAAGLAHAICGLSKIEAAQTERILPVVAMLVAGVVPRLSLSVGGLASADYRVRHVGQLSLETLRARYRQSNAILVGGLVGISLLVVWGTSQLTFHEGAWDRYLALNLAVVAILRSRIFSRTQHMAPLRAAGVVGLALQLIRLYEDTAAMRPWIVVIVVGIVAAAVAVSTLQMSEITRARVKRTLNIVEFLVVVDLIVLVCGATGVYDALGGLV